MESVFKKFPELTTKRLRLRQLSNKDETELLALRSNEEVNRFLDREPAKSLEDARIFIEKIKKGIGNHDVFYWAITLPADDKLIGTICLWNVSMENESAEIGYELNPAFQGKGYMQEALEAVLQFGFNKMQLKLIEACLQNDNTRSVKILEKNKFKLSPPARDEGGLMVTYCLYNK